MIELYAQMDNLVLVKTKEEGIIPFGFLVDHEKKKIIGDERNLFTPLKNGDWDKSELSDEETKIIINLVKRHIV